MARILRKDVIAALRAAQDPIRPTGFPIPGVANYCVAQRLHVYRGENSWAILIEVVEVTPHNVGHDTMFNSVYRYGNGLVHPPTVKRHDMRFFTDDAPGEPVFPNRERPGLYLNPKATAITLYGRRVAIVTDVSMYTTIGIDLAMPPHIMPHEMLRMIAWLNRGALFLDRRTVDDEVRRGDTLLMCLDEWYHPEVFPEDESFQEDVGQNETFSMLADVIATGDLSRYCPTTPPNTHWTNWRTAEQQGL